MSMPGGSVSQLLRAAEHELAGSDSARLDAEVLLQDLLEIGREWLYAHPEAPVDAGRTRDFFALVSRRRLGIPVAYLTGRREFWSLELQVDRHTLIPRPETELAVQTALELMHAAARPAVLDLGTGSGAIALAIARERPDAQVVASELSVEALSAARRNAARLGLGHIEFVQSDWFSNLPGRRFDVIVCNPPYVDSRDPALLEGEIRHEPRLALDGGYGGLQCISAVVAAASRHLRAGGTLVLEHGAAQAESVRHLLGLRGFAGASTRQDIAGLDRISLGRWE